jgi:hypothetical protein
LPWLHRGSLADLLVWCRWLREAMHFL